MATALHTATSSANLHTIETKPMPDRYARGWHCLGLASEFRDGKPHGISAFGTRLVAFLGEDGHMHILSAWCPHMGADLAIGRVEGNAVVCRFHGWAFSGDGACTHIPYSKTIPPKARVRNWPALEVNNLLFVWNDPEGAQPAPEMAIPQLSQIGASDWSDWSWSRWVINNNCRELVDNLADLGHFGPVHGSSNVKYFANIFDGCKATQVMVGINERLAGTRNYLKTVATYFGPAVLICSMTGENEGLPVESILLVSHVPIDQQHFELDFGVMVRKVPSLNDAQNAELAKRYVELAIQAFTEDVAVWHNKIRVDNPLLCAGDGPVLQLREWYEQFYTDRRSVPAKILQRREIEINLGLDEPHPPLQHAFGL